MKFKRAFNYREWILCLVLSAIGLLAGICFEQFTAHPRLEVESGEFNFGAVSGGVDVTHTFIIHNTGKRPLLISKIETSCGCIKEARMLDSSIVLPNHQGSLRVTLETPQFKTSIHENVNLYTNDPKTPIKPILLQCETNPTMDINPALISFGVVEESELPVSQKVTVNSSVSHNKKDWLRANSDCNYLSVSTSRSSGGTWGLSATLPRDSPLGPIGAQVVLRPSWCKSQGLTVLGEIVGDVYASPVEIFVRATDLRKKPTEDIEISARNQSVSSVFLISVSPALKKVLTLHFRDSGAKHWVSVNFNLRALVSTRVTVRGNLLLQVHLSNGKMKDLNIPVVVV